MQRNRMSTVRACAFYIIMLAVMTSLSAQAQDGLVATAPWANVGQGPGRTYDSPYAGPLNPPRELFQVPFAGDAVTHLLLGREGLIRAVSSDGYLYQFIGDTDDDDIVAALPLPWAVHDIAISQDGIAYLAGAERGFGKVLAVAEGSTLWEMQFLSQGDVSVLPSNEGLVVLTSDGMLFGIDGGGEEEWSYRVPGFFERCSVPAIARSGIIYFSVSGVSQYGGTLLKNSSVFAVSRDGVLLWDRPAPVDGLGDPVLDEDENVYMLGTSDGNLYSFCLAGLNWVQPVAEPYRQAYLAYHEGVIYVLSGGSVTAFDKVGQDVWLHPNYIGDCIVSAPAVGSDGMVYVLTRPVFQGSLPTLNAIGVDGSTKWSVPVHYDTSCDPIVTQDGDICIGTIEGGLVHFRPGRGDITPPYLAETFPPKDTIVPIDDFNLMMVVMDRGVGVNPSSIWVSVDSEMVETTKEEELGGYKLFVSPHRILAPFQCVHIEVSVDDKKFNEELIPYDLTAVEYRKRPKIVMGGFGNTEVTSKAGGELHAYALVDPLAEVASVKIHHPDSGAWMTLHDEGSGIDRELNGYWYSTRYQVPPGLQPGRYFFEMVVEDVKGNTSFTWPYLTVEPPRDDGGQRRSTKGSAGESYSLMDALTIEGPALAECAPEAKTTSTRGEVNAPIIRAAGYTYSLMTTEGGVVRFEAWVYDWNGIDDIRRVEVYFGGNPTGLCLNNDGQFGDRTPGDNIFTYQAFFDEVIANGAYLFELKAVDMAGNESSLWPYLEIK